MSVMAPIKVITDGLVMCLDVANEKSYPGSGTTINDLTENKYVQTATSATFGTVDGAKCLDCSATGRTNISGSGYTFGTSWTMISWARIISATTTWRTLWRTAPDDHPILVETGANRLGYYDNNGGGFLASGLDVSTLGLVNKWTMYTIAQTSTTNINFYINDLIARGSVTASLAGNSHYSWGSTSDGGQPFGYLAVALLYNRNLNNSEILQNYNALKGRFGK